MNVIIHLNLLAAIEAVSNLSLLKVMRTSPCGSRPWAGSALAGGSSAVSSAVAERSLVGAQWDQWNCQCHLRSADSEVGQRQAGHPAARARRSPLGAGKTPWAAGGQVSAPRCRPWVRRVKVLRRLLGRYLNRRLTATRATACPWKGRVMSSKTSGFPGNTATSCRRTMLARSCWLTRLRPAGLRPKTEEARRRLQAKEEAVIQSLSKEEGTESSKHLSYLFIVAVAIPWINHWIK